MGLFPFAKNLDSQSGLQYFFLSYIPFHQVYTWGEGKGSSSGHKVIGCGAGSKMLPLDSLLISQQIARVQLNVPSEIRLESVVVLRNVHKFLDIPPFKSWGVLCLPSCVGWTESLASTEYNKAEALGDLVIKGPATSSSLSLSPPPPVDCSGEVTCHV